jgi:hypothetical protein
MIDINKMYEEGQKRKVIPLPPKAPEEKSIRRHALKQIDRKYKNRILENVKR